MDGETSVREMAKSMTARLTYVNRAMFCTQGAYVGWNLASFVSTYIQITHPF